MALTRRMLKAMGIEEEKIDQIIDAHTETTDALKADRDKYKEAAEKIPGLERDLQNAKDAADAAAKDSYKEKYESEKQAFADYKKGVEAEQTKAKKTAAFKELLKKAGVSEKRIDAVVKVTPLDEIELDKDGKIKDADEKEKSIKEEWSEFIVRKSEEGADTETPPGGVGAGAGGRTLSRAAMIAQKHNERMYGVKGDIK